jgi:hypothetical protein
MILGGRYQESTNTGSFNGMPFEGISTVGYDNAKKKYVSTWVDNMGTGIMYLEGTWNNATRMGVFTGTAIDPMTGKECNIRQTLKIIDENTQEMEMFDNKMGKETKTMHIKLMRNK